MESPNSPPAAAMSDITASSSDAGASVPIISTVGLFKSKGKKRNANINIKQTATHMFDDEEVASFGQPSAVVSKPSSFSSSSATAQDHEDESAIAIAIAVSGGSSVLSAAAIREEREKRKREKRIKQMEQVAKRDQSEGVSQPAVPVSNSTSSSGASYSKEALAELRKNTKSFQPQPSTQANAPTESGTTQDISIDLDDEMQVNLAGLPSSSSSLDLPISSSFRASSHAKHQQMQDADDLKRIKRKLDTAVSASSQDDMKRERELEKLAEERMIRAAKLKRQQMRENGAVDSMEVDHGEDGNRSLQLHNGKVSLDSTVLDKPYALAVRTVDEEEDGVDARLLREDADDAMIHEFDDEERGLRQGQAAGDRLKFGDPASSRVSKKQEIGSLLNASSTAAAKKKRGDAIRTALRADDEMDEDEEDGFDLDDDETKAWEQEMIKKGGGGAKANGPPASKSKATRASAQANLSTDAQSLSQQIDSSLASAAASLGTVASLVDPVDLLYQSIDTQLSSMRVSHNKLNTKFHQLEQAILTEQKANHQLKDKLDDQNNAFVFYQELSENLITAFDCLSEKSRDIDAADNELRAMKLARKKEVDARILEHETDLWKESGLGGDSDDAMEVSEPQVDEFGRDIGFVHDSEKVRRKDMRTEWFTKQANQIRDARTNKDKASTLPIQIKLNSKERKVNESDALGAESLHDLVVSKADLGSTRYDEAVSSLLSDTTHIFADTAPTFRTMTAMKGWLEDWKRNYRSTYMEAYMPDSTAIIFAPYVKLELLQTWNLLQHPHFSEPPPRTNSSVAQPVSWYQQLFDYGMESDSSDVKAVESEEGDDSKLLPTLIQQILVPQVTAFVELEFDPFAIHSHVSSLKSCLLEIEAHLIGEPSKIPQWQTLRSTLLRIYQKAIEQHIEQFSVVPVADPTSAPSLQGLNQSTYCTYRYYRASSLLESLTAFQSLLDFVSVRNLSIQLVTRALLPLITWKTVEAKSFVVSANQQGWSKISADLNRDHSSSLVIASQNIRLDPLSELHGLCHQLNRIFPSSWLIASGRTEVSHLKIIFDLLQQLQQTRATQSKEVTLEVLNRLKDSLNDY